MKKQTAVEWLAERCGLQALEDVIEEAKQMEKEQIIDAHGVKNFRGIQQGVDFWQQVTGEQYYNETYGGQDE